MKYAFIAEHIGQFQVTTMARVLGVARSGFYVWQARQGKVSARTQAQHELEEFRYDQSRAEVHVRHSLVLRFRDAVHQLAGRGLHRLLRLDLDHLLARVVVGQQRSLAL